jgi:hypothetical protein
MCHIAYEVAPRNPFVEHGRGIAAVSPMPAPTRADGSLVTLLVMNLVVLGLAHYLQFSLRGLMMVYWVQSVVIGICHFIRMIKADNAGTYGPSSREERRRWIDHTAAFFAVHYGLFHVGYLFFLTFDAEPGELATPLIYLLCGAVFAINHAQTLLRNLAKDAAAPLGRDVNTLLFFPYLRVLPMHAAIIAGLLLDPGAHGVLLFGLLKTAADAVMHLVEQNAFK